MNKTPGYKASVSTDSCNTVLVAQTPSHLWLFVTPRTAAHQASLSFTISQSLFKLMSFELVMLSNHLILCHPLLLPSIFPSIRVFSDESVLHIRWPEYWSFSFSMSPSNEYLGLISFRMDWFDLLAVQVTLKSLLQHQSSKASILQHSVFFQLVNSYLWSVYYVPGTVLSMVDTIETNKDSGSCESTGGGLHWTVF